MKQCREWSIHSRVLPSTPLSNIISASHQQCMQLHYVSLQQIKEMDMVDYLKSLGHQLQRTNGNDYWYLSPLREERTPSFKVNRQLNCWYDHSIGTGGNLVDFLLLYHHCTAKELLQRMNNSLSFHQPKQPIVSSVKDSTNTLATETKIKGQNDPDSSPEREQKGGITIIGEKLLTNTFLLSYVRSRCIPVALAQIHLKEVHYELSRKPYYALGFRNDSGGYELRNKYFKGSTSPKDVTTIVPANSTEEISVFEGFFSFLSYLALGEKHPFPLTNVLVLNSLSLFHKNITKMEHYSKVHLYLDNDTAGNEVTARALQRSEKFRDERMIYGGYKDFNEWLVQQKRVQKQSHRLRW